MRNHNFESGGFLELATCLGLLCLTGAPCRAKLRRRGNEIAGRTSAGAVPMTLKKTLEEMQGGLMLIMDAVKQGNTQVAERLLLIVAGLWIERSKPSGRNDLQAGAEGEMTDAFLAMQYPHWLFVAGAILVVLGFMGLALRQGKGVEVDYEFTELPTQANRKAKLAEQTRSRWATAGEKEAVGR